MHCVSRNPTKEESRPRSALEGLRRLASVGAGRVGLAALLALAGSACRASDAAKGPAVGAAPEQRGGTIAFAVVADEHTTRSAPRRDYAHWNAGGAWSVPSQPIWTLEAPLLSCRVERAATTVDELGYPALQLALDPRDAPAFRALGERALGRRLAVLVGERVVVTPRVGQPLTQTFQLAGNFSDADVRLLLEQMSSTR